MERNISLCLCFMMMMMIKNGCSDEVVGDDSSYCYVCLYIRLSLTFVWVGSLLQKMLIVFGLSSLVYCNSTFPTAVQILLLVGQYTAVSTCIILPSYNTLSLSSYRQIASVTAGWSLLCWIYVRY